MMKQLILILVLHLLLFSINVWVVKPWHNDTKTITIALMVIVFCFQSNSTLSMRLGLRPWSFCVIGITGLVAVLILKDFKALDRKYKEKPRQLCD
jgi:hypothetical protein